MILPLSHELRSPPDCVPRSLDSGRRITIDGDSAHIRAHVRAEHWLAPLLVPDESDNCWLIVGFCDDEAVRTPDGWRIERVKLTVTYQQNAHLRLLSNAEGLRTAQP